MTNEEMVYYLEHVDITVGQKCKTKTAEAIEKALKIIKSQPCEDCISRQALIEKATSWDKHFADSERYVSLTDIQHAPPVTPQTRWIPCNERLPKENEYIRNVCKYYLIQDEYGDMHVAHLSNVGWIPMDSLKAIGDEVIAWRELPLPYKAEPQESESDVQ